MATRVFGRKVKLGLIPNERRLDPQAVEWLADMRTGDAIIYTCGILWVTQEGDPEDYVLQKGAAFVANRRGVVVVQALAKARYFCINNDKMYGWIRRN